MQPLTWLILALLGIPARPACLEGHPTIQEEFHHSAAVFIGRVVGSRHDTATREWLEGTTYMVDVERVFRGQVPPKVELFSENSSGRFPMDSDSVYLVFAYKNLGRLAVDNCGNSGFVSAGRQALSTVERLAR